ncbi:terpene cyclase/mutase family protein [Rhodopirellula sp. JC740]|uniref:Terpene cyclase/mutase family protein n=2 Tax=Rhodopirellula halodulae TaxID=2894198 RepID=A0ABS8NG27_9BACT|nr:terpene cyclase/mutase family protein [Rhodopirellula sp. JC740]
MSRNDHAIETRRQCLARLLTSSLGMSMLGGSLTAMNGTATRAAEDPRDLYADDSIDQSVRRGVQFLLRLQKADGSIADRGNSTAMTSLVIMALASIGTIPEPGTAEGRAMSRAIEFVLQPRNQTKGYFGHHDGSRMYGHGITTLMLTEILGMGATIDQNERIHQALVQAIQVILKSQAVRKPQRLQGGWRYKPDSRDSDLSVSVWQVMALRSAKNDGLDVPAEAIEFAVEYLEESYTSPLDENGQPREKVSGFAYTPGTHHPAFTMTAAGLLAMQTCGRYDSPLVAGAAAWLLEHPPRTNERFFFYGMYYYAQGMHQVGGEAAETAAKLVPELLLRLQSDNGSWVSHQGEERNVGLAYATALSILSLSVRYHYLPIYQR